MKRLFTVSVFSLLLLAALSFSGTADVQAQGRSNHHYQTAPKSPGPPAWAPAHGQRRNHADHYQRDSHKSKHKKNNHCEHCYQDSKRYSKKKKHKHRDDHHHHQTSHKRAERVLKNGKVIVVVNQ